MIAMSSWTLCGLCILLLIGSAAASDVPFIGMGFSFQYPVGWTVSDSGSQVAGNLSMMNSGVDIVVTWMRDPGFTPEKILDQIVNVYSQGGVEVLSQEKAQISVQGQKAETLDLSYRFNDYEAKKRFAAWISNESDRMFFVSMSSSSENYTNNKESLNYVLSTFHDQEAREETLGPRSAQDDAWAIVLRDLLASYYYKDQSVLQPRAVYVHATHSLTPVNGSYHLSSFETIRSDMLKTTVIRSAAVQELLQDFGYDSVIIQKSGQIWVVVKDPSGRWQSISLNPEEPWRMIGALVIGREGYLGLMYNNSTELAKANLLTMNDPIDSKYVQKSCDPSRYAELNRPSQENGTWADELQSFLDSYSYPQKYQKNVFVCSNTSQICWAMLEGKGYDARLMFSYKGHPLGQHMWVVVRYPYEDGRYVAIEATNTNDNGDILTLGKVVFKDEYFRGIMYNTSKQFSWLNPKEGMWLVPNS